jgi:NAD(P)-dependent dehydrogenase (short-subunit alcohol dehydrogenase family)
MSNHGRLGGKVAVITGASSGIGKATAILFAKEGAKIAIAGRNEERLEETLQACKKQGAEVVSKITDVSIESDVKALIDLALETYGQIDVLVNNAGFGGGASSVFNENTEQWLKVLNTNVMGMVYGTKYVAEHMKERKSGTIVNVASVAGIRAGAGGNAYSASKAAMINYTKTSACDFGEYGVRVNVVCPGLIETGMTKRVFDYARSTGKEARLGSRCELRRYGVPDEIAYPILFCACDESSYMTGQAVVVDGGNTASLNLPGMKA